MNKRTRQQGFTLLEVMLVVLLMGLMAATVTLSIGSGGQQQSLTREAQRFIATTEALQDESVLSGGFFGIVIEKDKYHYVMMKEGKWQPVEKDNLLSERQMPAGITTELEVEGLPLQQDEDQQSWFDEPLIDEDAEQKKKFPEPQIMLLPSGEMTGFKLRFVASGDSGQLETVVSGNSLGQLKLGEFDELS